MRLLRHREGGRRPVLVILAVVWACLFAFMLVAAITDRPK